MHIQVHKICNGCNANFEQSFAYKIKNYSIETIDFENSDEFLKFYHINFLIYLRKKLFSHI